MCFHVPVNDTSCPARVPFSTTGPLTRNPPKRTSYPACGGMHVLLRPRVPLPLPSQDVPHHPDELEQHETGDEGQQVFLLDGGTVVRDGQHQRRSNQQHVGAVLAAEELGVLPRVVPGQALLQLGENLLVVFGAGRRRRRAVAILVQTHDIQAAVLHHGDGVRVKHTAAPTDCPSQIRAL